MAELAEARSTWSRAEVAKVVARRLPPDLAGDAEAGREWIEATSAAVLAHPEVVTLAAPLSAEVPTGLRAGTGCPPTNATAPPVTPPGRPCPGKDGSSTRVGRGRHAGVAVADADRRRAGGAGPIGLGADQAAALRRICLGGERIVCVVGPAGRARPG